MSNSPVISIVIPLYNKGQYIEDTLRSILVQTYQDFEVIVVDDGSTDDGMSLVHQMDDIRIHEIRQENAGVSAARNLGASKAKGEYLAFLDADDRWHNCFLEYMLKACSQKGVNWVMCAEDHVSEDSILLNSKKCVPSQEFEKRNFFELFLNNQMGCPGTVLLRKKAFNENQGFVNGIKNGEDVEMWLRFALSYPEVKFCSERLVQYMTDSPGGATVINRSEESLVLFWRAMAELSVKSKGTPNCDLFSKCFNKFANRSYRFYVRGRYYLAADYLFTLPSFSPVLFNRALEKLPKNTASILLVLINHARHIRLSN